MSTSTINPSSRSESLEPIIKPGCAAASAAIVYRGLEIKSALQRGTQPGRFSVGNCLKTATILSAQVTLEAQIRGCVSQISGRETNPLIVSGVSSTAAAVGSIPPLAMINGMTVGLSPYRALRALTPQQARTLCVREGGFMYGVSTSEPFAREAEAICGDHPVVRIISNAVVGGTAAVLSHPADTFLTRLQSNEPITMSIENARHLMKGVRVRTVSVAAFNVIYQETSSQAQKWVDERVID